MPARWLLLLVLLLPWRAHATIFLAWEFDRAYQPVPTGFDLALEGPISPGKGSVTQTIRVGPSAPWACAFLPDDVFETFCAELACPGPGIFKATAYAIWADRKSGPSNTSTMEVVTAPVCAALRIEIPSGETTDRGTTDPVRQPGLSLPNRADVSHYDHTRNHDHNGRAEAPDDDPAAVTCTASAPRAGADRRAGDRATGGPQSGASGGSIDASRQCDGLCGTASRGASAATGGATARAAAVSLTQKGCAMSPKEKNARFLVLGLWCTAIAASTMLMLWTDSAPAGWCLWSLCGCVCFVTMLRWSMLDERRDTSADTSKETTG